MDQPDLSSLSAEVIDLGFLIGLLTGSHDSPDIDTDWFSNPVDSVLNGFNWPNLKPILEQFLGSAQNPVEGNGAGPFFESWYPIQVEDDDGKTVNSCFYFVEKTSENNALLGVGVHHQFDVEIGSEKVTIHPFMFLPVFQMPDAPGAKPVFTLDLNGPVEIGVQVSYSGTFSSLVPYNGLIFMAGFNFSSLTPDITFLLQKPGSNNFSAVPTVTATDAFNAILGLKPVVNFLQTNILPADAKVNFNWGQLFNAIGWLTGSSAPYTVANISISGIPGALKDYISTLLVNAFKKFMGSNQVIYLVSSDPEKTDGATWKIGLILDNYRYGINIEVLGVCISQSPLVNLQLGALTTDETDWIDEAGGNTPAANGLSFFLLNNQSGNITFDPQFEAVNVGLDISKSSGQPLFNVKGYTLNLAQLRGYFSTLQSAWGVAAAVNGIALPLGPPGASGGGTVPQTLMASADTPKDKGDTKPVVNPEFSFLAAYAGEFYFQLFDKNGKPEDIVLIPLQRSFGPVALKDIGIGWQNDDYKLLFQLDGSVNLNALTIGLDKLSIGIPVKTPGDISTYDLDLAGMDISFKSGSVSIAGGFLKNDTFSPAQYNGAVVIQVASWGITALGSFATINNSPSLFIFGVLNAALGGPPVFFVTGIAAGFSYNRALIMPAIDQVQNFPFVKAAVQPGLFSGKDTNTILNELSTYIPPALGQYWFAAGVKFTSFELLNSFALLAMQFGKRVEIGLLGLSSLQLPKQYADPDLKPYVNVELVIKATFDPDQGILAVEGQLSDNSFVIDPACHITGGFAYYSWFKGDYAGDFVVTMGGYNQNFDPPAHYPSVPRLGFNWNVSDSITVSGEAYFALTPSCVMAGGKLSLTYQDGDLQAWYKAVADFLISWKPFHYDINIGISIGVSYTINLLFIRKTISVELGVDVHLWGPAFGGNATVSLWIISFTIGFGADNDNSGKTIDWTDFEGYFLPDGAAEQSKALSNGIGLAADSETKPVITINASAGLTEKCTIAGIEYWVVDPGSFVFNAESAVPASQVSFAAGPVGSNDAPATISCEKFGIKPLGPLVMENDASDFNLGLTLDGAPYSLVGWNFGITPKSVPAALWATTNDGVETPSADMIAGITSGIASASPPVPALNGPPEFDMSILGYVTIQNEALLTLDSSAVLRQVTLNSAGSLQQIKDTLAKPATITMRNGVFAALTDMGTIADTNNDLSIMAAAPEDIFQGSPMLADASAEARPLNLPKSIAVARPKLRPNAALGGHRLRAAIIKYSFGTNALTGNALRGGKYNTASTKLRHGNDKAAAENDRKNITLRPGTLLLWDLDKNVDNGGFTHDGRIPVKMILFDKNLEIIDEPILREKAWVAVGSNATTMCLQAVDGAVLNNQLSGWHQNAKLPLLNPKYLLGINCLVRPKNPQRAKFKRSTYDAGLVSGRSVVLNNLDAAVSGRTVTGWIETRFSSSVKQVFVLTRPVNYSGDGNNTLSQHEVKMIYTNKNGSKKALTLLPVALGLCGSESWASYTIHAVTEQGHFSIWTAAESGGQTQLAGVAGVQTALDEWTEALNSELRGSDPALSPENASRYTSIEFKHNLIF